MRRRRERGSTPLVTSGRHRIRTTRTIKERLEMTMFKTRKVGTEPLAEADASKLSCTDIAATLCNAASSVIAKSIRSVGKPSWRRVFQGRARIRSTVNREVTNSKRVNTGCWLITGSWSTFEARVVPTPSPATSMIRAFATSAKVKASTIARTAAATMALAMTTRNTNNSEVPTPSL
eukprot:6200980-Pleurochrysis_carterae.AAC.2